MIATRRVELLEYLQDKPVAFNRSMLRRSGYYGKQQAIARSVVDHQITLVPSGNMTGKTYLVAGLILWFLFTRRDCIVLATAPSQTQLEQVLWRHVESAYEGSPIDLGARMLKSPLKIELPDGRHALAYSTKSVERMSGHHAPELFCVVDEASGVDPAIFEALRSCNPSREILIGNPLRPDGYFYDACQQAAKNPFANLIKLSSYDSPHINEDRSPWGLADRTWLENIRNDFGEGSAYWLSHVEGRFPDDVAETVLNREWLELAELTLHVPSGPCRTAIDLAEGRGGDRSVVLTRDDNGIVALESSNRWKLEETAAVAVRHVNRFQVEANHVSWDVAGIGADFENRLSAAGIKGARPYRGGAGTYKKFGNLRSAAAWSLRQRLDPNRMVESRGFQVPQHPFAIPKRFTQGTSMMEELRGLRYEQDPTGRICLEIKEDYAERLKHSPDFADALTQSFAFPD